MQPCGALRAPPAPAARAVHRLRRHRRASARRRSSGAGVVDAFTVVHRAPRPGARRRRTSSPGSGSPRAPSCSTTLVTAPHAVRDRRPGRRALARRSTDGRALPVFHPSPSPRSSTWTSSSTTSSASSAALLRTFVDREIVPVAREWEHAGRYPTEIVDGDAARWGCSASPCRRSTAASTLDLVSFALVFEEIARGWMGIAGHPRQPLAGLPADRHARHRGAEAALPARPRHRRAPHRHRRSPSPTPAPTCRASAPPPGRDGDHYVVNGTQDVDHQRPATPTRCRCWCKTDPTAEPGAQGHVGAAGRGRHARLRGHRGHPEARLQGHRVLRDRARRRAGAGRPTCSAASRAAACSRCCPALEMGPGQHRRPLGRHRPGAPTTRRSRYARQRKAFGQPIARLPGDPAQARPTWRPQVQAARLMAYWAAPAPTPGPGRHGDRDGQDLLLRGGRRGALSTDAGARRLRLLQGVRGRAALPRRDPDEHRRGHQRHPAHRRRQVAASSGKGP